MDKNNQQNDQFSPNSDFTEVPTPEYTQPEVPSVVTPESIQQPSVPDLDQSAIQSPAQPVSPSQQVASPGYNPGETLGIISIIMTIPLGLSLVGLILGVLSRKRSQEASASTTLGTVGIVLGAIGTAVVTLGIIAFIALIAISGAARSTDSGSDLFDDSNESSSSTL